MGGALMNEGIPSPVCEFLLSQAGLVASEWAVIKGGGFSGFASSSCAAAFHLPS